MASYMAMDYYISEFCNYLNQGIQIGKAFKLRAQNDSIHNVLLIGLGGSGIGAEIVHNYVESFISVPFIISKDYSIPGFVGKNTLVIACSYSGNTEETLKAVASAKEKDAQIICITSGGKLKEFASQNNAEYMLLPSDIPPRACVSCSFTPILFILNRYNLLEDDFVSELDYASSFLQGIMEEIKADARNYASLLIGKLPIIYSDQRISSIGTRWRQQFNENSKVLGWERAFPEMNHNELVGWRDECTHLAVLFLTTGEELEAIKMRMDISKNLVRNYTETLIDVPAKGNSFLCKMLYLTLIGDWTSWYLAQLRGVDAVEVKVIDFLKSELEKQR